MTPSQTGAEPAGGGIALDHSPKRLLAQRLAHEDGTGEALDLRDLQGQPVEITLEIDHVVQQESLAISIWGSPDGADWGHRPLVMLPQKHYCGVYSMPLNLANHPHIRFLRAEWKLSCWRKGCDAPLFGFTLSVEEAGSRWARRGSPVRTQAAGGDQELHNAGLGALADGIAAID